MFSLRPLTYRLGLLMGLGGGELAAAAEEQWQISPSEMRRVPPVIILPGQIERVTRTEFTTLPLLVKSLDGDPAEKVGPTTAYRLTDVDIVDGVLYSHGVSVHLRERRHRMALGHLEAMASGSLYETWVGNRWFGNWLLDDCLTYRLAEEVGQPVTTMPPRKGHVPRYESMLSITQRRITNAHFDELVLFDDHANNSNRLARAQDMRARLLAEAGDDHEAGVFLVRGNSGDQRMLENEAEIAGILAQEYGFRIMFAEDHSVDEIVAACRSAGIVAGVEGSQLNHGIAAMAPGGTLLTLQPPDRTTTAMKLLTDRWQQRMAMVVGQGRAESFRIDPREVRRTLDLIRDENEKSPS
ncbi:MAG: glycosyltransferase family 61 protein [Paracoccus sp. (in: a-proteobacteria)]|uniref:glycosyltransferase family 61 protein n=1 Tax=Paracoccus sp. TaxID=267 RepID=UPI0039E3CA13